VPADHTVGEKFRLAAATAGEVLLAGDFTSWQQGAIAMQAGDDGIWTTTVKLPPGTYQYLFVVDGKWHEDPACTSRMANSVGGYNMLRRVEIGEGVKPQP
jgi:1,4-alpha-glucan branching enzyme